MPRHSKLEQTSSKGDRSRRGWFKLKAEGGGGNHLPGDRKRMRLDGNLGLVEMTEDSRIYILKLASEMNLGVYQET